MAVLRNIDVSNKIGVSPATVQNWIRYSLSGKIHLDLTKIANRHYIEDTIENIDRMQKLKNQGVKYRSKTDWITVEPVEKFYEIFTETQIIDLINNIKFHHNIPIKYSYTYQGIKFYADAIEDELKENNNAISKSAEQANQYLKEIVSRFAGKNYQINLIEIGHDFQTYEVQEAVKTLIKGGNLRKYISVSISKEMHELREKTLKKNLGLRDDQFKSVYKDYETESLQSLLFHEKQKDIHEDEDTKIINICLYLTGTLGNYLHPEVLLNRLAEGLDEEDFIVISTALTDRKGNDLIERESNNSANRAKRHDWLLKYLNIHKYIDMSGYEYSLEHRMRIKTGILRDHIELKVKIGNNYQYIQLPRDFKLVYFMSKRFGSEEILNLIEPMYKIQQMNTMNNEQIVFLLLNARAQVF
jgi:hypothetical protein